MIRTLAARLVILTALWAVIATAVVAIILSANFRNSVEDGLRDRLTANLYNIMGAITIDDDRSVSGQPDLRDSRFLRIGSGYFWSVTPVRQGRSGNPVLRSQSLAGGNIAVPDDAQFNTSFQREFVTIDDAGRELIGIEARAFLGDGDQLFSFAITASRSEADAQVAAFTRQLLIILGLFALGFVVVAYFLVRLGLAPISRATSQLARIRDGEADAINGRFPSEIQPLIDETNALISSNRSVVERARTQVGNLAHSLKTPLAVLRNEARVARPQVRKVIDQQVDLMQGQVQTYLNRAQIAARSGAITSRTPVIAPLERLVRVMRKLNPRIEFDLAVSDPGLSYAGEAQDLEEMVGNLIENASKFAEAKVAIEAHQAQGRVVITVTDDGPGMDGAQMKEAVKRGTRLDETKPGSGLGLSIVRDIAAEYKGELVLERAQIGGLKARLILPAARGGH